MDILKPQTKNNLLFSHFGIPFPSPTSLSMLHLLPFSQYISSVIDLSGAEKALMTIRKKVHCDHFLGTGSGSEGLFANKSKNFVCKLYKNRTHVSFYF